MYATATKTIEQTETFRELVRIGATTTAWNSNGKKLNHNVGENMLTPSFDEDGKIVLWDGHICTWGPDAELAQALSTLDAGASFEEICGELSDFPNNA